MKIFGKKMSIGDFINYFLLLLVSFVCVLPFIYIVSVSLTDPDVYKPFTLYFFPEKISFDVYKYILQTNFFTNGLKNTIIVTVIGTVLNLLFTFTAAYALSAGKNYPGKKAFLAFVLFTLVFNAGIIPNYILVRNLNLMNSLWSIILPGLTNAWSLIVVKSFMESIPRELEESAKIDGCTEIRIFARIVLPLSAPSLASFTLFFAVAHWNAYFIPQMYLSDNDLWTVQLIVRTLVMDAGSDNLGVVDELMPQETLKMASVVLAMLPILVVYPFLQRYFVKGMMIGAVKG